MSRCGANPGSVVTSVMTTWACCWAALPHADPSSVTAAKYATNSGPNPRWAAILSAPVAGSASCTLPRSAAVFVSGRYSACCTVWAGSGQLGVSQFVAGGDAEFGVDAAQVSVEPTGREPTDLSHGI